MDETELTLLRRVRICLRIFTIACQLRITAVVGYFCGVFTEIGGTLLSIYATAKLGGLLASFLSTGRTDYIWMWLWVDVFAVSLIGLGFLAMSYCKRLLYFAFVRWVINSLLSTLCQMDLGDFYKTDVRNRLNKVSGAYIWQMPNLSEAFLDLIYGVLRFGAITIVVSQITWWLVPVIALFLIPTLIGESRLAKMQWFVWDTKGDFRHIFWGLEYIVRQAKGQMEIRSTQASNYILKKIDHMNKVFYDEQQDKFRNASRVLIPTKILEVVGTTIGSVFVLRQFLSRTISLERYLFLSGALLRIGGALNNIFGTLSRMQESLLFASSYFAVVDAKPSLVDQTNSVQLSNNNAPSIEFVDVSFTYPDQPKPVFEHLNLHLKGGEHLALVGENGAGKSTLIKLLLRFYKPTSGQILINGKDLNDIAIGSWYTQLATLFQDFNQYPLPIDENIQIGRSNQKPNQALLEKAAGFAGVDELVEGYEHGWDTVLDSSFAKGVEPSGGQWQRVALARAFYRQANVIVLDEPTSAIDARAEYQIFNSIFDHYKNKTALIVSHRFSTVRRADRIVVLDQGKVIEEGTHTELMKQKGMYHDLFSKQAEGYK